MSLYACHPLQCFISILFLLQPIQRTLSDSPKPQQITFPRQVLLFTAVPFHSVVAGSFRIRHMNHSICSLNATGNSVFPCTCFGFPSNHYELLIGNVLIHKFSVIAGKKFWRIPENPISCQPLVIEFDFDNLCEELNLSLHLQYAPFTVNTATDSQKLKTEVEMPVRKEVLFPCHHLCLPGIYRIILMNGERTVQMIERIELEQTDEIAVSLPRPYIFPRCFDYLKITWTSLSCPVQNLEFKMRVFAVPEASNFEQSYYMEEYDIGNQGGFMHPLEMRLIQGLRGFCKP